jgi:Tfp pilus assembly protein PilF
VLSHPCVVGSAPLSYLLETDYWGVPLSHSGSHKSYRPLTTLSFRLDWLVAPAGQAAAQFHLTNVLLHAAVTGLYVHFCRGWVRPGTALVAGLLFAVHPVHCEAVAGVAGRADVLAGLLYLACLTAHRQLGGWSLTTPLLAAAAMLAKEQGVTALAACAIMDLLDLNATKKPQQRTPTRRWGILYLGLSTIILLSLRSLALDGQLPTFSRSDNPAAHSSSLLTRTLTFLLLPVLNWLLLACPSTLSYDWSMDSVPLVTSLSDPRNLLTACFYSVLAYSLMRAFGPVLGVLLQKPCKVIKSHPNGPALAVALSLTILPFLPATNLFFYVGFVLAERVLYIPSLGYVLLLAVGLDQMARHHPRATKLCTAGLILVLSLRTLARNRDWRDEKDLFLSSVGTNPAKSWSNLGSVLHARGEPAFAELALKQALLLRPNMADSHYNLGVLFQGQGRLTEASAAYTAAIQYRPQLGIAYLNLGLVYTELGRRPQAIAVLRSCAQLEDTGLKDPRGNARARISARLQLGRLLLQSGDVSGALAVLEAAQVESRDEGGQQLEAILNSLGDCHQARGSLEEAEHWYSQSLAVNPAHLPAHLTLAKLLAKNVSIQLVYCIVM